MTGSSGSGTTSVRNTFEQIFRREGVEAVFIEGDAFHAFDRAQMRAAEAREPTLSHFGERANLLAELEAVFREYAASGRGAPGTTCTMPRMPPASGPSPAPSRPGRSLRRVSDLLFYEGLHGALVNERVDIAGQADLRIGVVPVINLEWIQKLHRDKAARGYSIEAVTDVILRRMPDYVTTICPQFTNTDINFQRIPTVDTSNPFVARWIPTADESMVVIRFRDPKGIDFPYLISMIAGSFMSRANSVVIPGGKLDLAMQLILTPMILRLVERRRRLL